MTTKQPDPLILATQPGSIVPVDIETTAALCGEVRRLHALNQELVEALRKCSAQLTRLGYSANHADAALAKATGETK